MGASADRRVVNLPSIALWQSYFTKAHIYGLDISDCGAFQNDRFTFLHADCGDPIALRRAAQQGVMFDVIIDDGSHASYHQQQTLLELFTTLRPGGLYIIEDLHWQPPAYEGSLPYVPKTSALLMGLDNLLEANAASVIAYARWEDLRNKIESITPYTNDQIYQNAYVPPRRRLRLALRRARQGLRRSIGLRVRTSEHLVKLIVIKKKTH